MPKAKIPLISVAEIGQLALKVFLNDKNERTDQRIIGPELITYDQVRFFCAKIRTSEAFD